MVASDEAGATCSADQRGAVLEGAFLIARRSGFQPRQNRPLRKEEREHRIHHLNTSTGKGTRIYDD
jgi:hypothetical protein